MADTARGFCAVSAASTVQPCSPYAWNALRSACTPAFPPESEPATVRQHPLLFPSLRIPAFPPYCATKRKKSAVSLSVRVRTVTLSRERDTTEYGASASISRSPMPGAPTVKRNVAGYSSVSP